MSTEKPPESPPFQWIAPETVAPGKLAIMPCPDGGEALNAQIAALAKCGVNVLVSLLEPQEVEALGLEGEADLCAAAGIEFIRYPIADRGLPGASSQTFARFNFLGERLSQGKSIVIHCHMGIGRSALVAACLLGLRGIEAPTAFAQIAEARGCPVPDTTEQWDWACAFTKKVLEK